MNKENFEKLLQANREAKAELFNMGIYVGTKTTCGTPACLLGNYALRPDLQSVFQVSERHHGSIEVCATARLVDYASREIQEHFDITSRQAVNIFGSLGCGGADRYRDAAIAYVEHFMATGETPACYEDEDEVCEGCDDCSGCDDE